MVRSPTFHIVYKKGFQSDICVVGDTDASLLILKTPWACLLLHVYSCINNCLVLCTPVLIIVYSCLPLAFLKVRRTHR